MEMFSVVTTIAIFIVVGFYLQIGFKLPPTLLTLFSLGCGFIVASSVGVNVKLISVMQVSVFLNNCLQGLVLGVFARVAYKLLQVKKSLSK
ncbi:MAG: hypothetical protein Q8S39_03865 [Ignavibacteria bacterium]|nr:hypothetical protein [Ignavibacteria bacterium]